MGGRHDVDGNGNRAELQNGEVGHDELGYIGEHDSHLVPLCHAECLQPVAEGVDRPVQLRVGNNRILIYEGYPVGVFTTGALQHLAQILFHVHLHHRR